VDSTTQRLEGESTISGEGSLPSRIGSYIVEALIESNAYHECYRGFDPVKKIPVFIKRLTNHAQQSQGPAKDHFSREIRFLRTLNHPHLCHMLQAGMENGRSYLVCPYISGITLREFLLKELPRPSESLSIIRQIASALSYLHTKQIIHNDLKPENILITPSLEAILIDFSISAHLGGHQDRKVNQLAGTLLYMSPERQSHTAVTSIASDLYSFAIICYELLTGHLSYGMIQLANLPIPLQPVFARGLQNDPRLRYQSIDQFLLEIERHKESLAGLHLPLRRKKRDSELIEAGEKGQVLKTKELNCVFTASHSFDGERELLSVGHEGKTTCITLMALPASQRHWLYYLKGQLDGFLPSSWEKDTFCSWLQSFERRFFPEEPVLEVAWVCPREKEWLVCLKGKMMAVCLEFENHSGQSKYRFFESNGPWKEYSFSQSKQDQILLVFPKNDLPADVILNELLKLPAVCAHDLYAFCHVGSRRLADVAKKRKSKIETMPYIAIPTLGLMPVHFSSLPCKKILPEGINNV
jgi:serine/threonine protein kinase